MPLYCLTQMSIRPDRVGECEEIARRMAESGAASARSPRWAVYEVSSDDFGSFLAVMQADSWEQVGAATLDGAVRALAGQTEASRLLERLGESILRARQQVVRDRPELSLLPEAPGPYPILESIAFRARPGGDSAIAAYLREVAEAARKTGDPRRFFATQTVLGDLGTYGMTTPVAAVGDLETLRSPADLLAGARGGPEGARVQERFLEAIDWADRSVLVLREELSNWS